MANEVQFARQESSLTLYFAVRAQDGRVWDTSANMGAGGFVAINAVTWSNADIALTEQGSTGDYYGTFPTAIPDESYTIEIFEQTGASPVRKADILLAQAKRVWRNGTLNSAEDLL
jgi:hypothetical protein